MTKELREKHVEALISISANMLRAFRSGHSPTFDQLDRLECCLVPFTTDKLCGHRLDEECDCAELNGILHPMGADRCQIHYPGECDLSGPSCVSKKPAAPSEEKR